MSFMKRLKEIFTPSEKFVEELKDEYKEQLKDHEHKMLEDADVTSAPEEPAEKVLDISEPIYTIVEKIKENPKRIVFGYCVEDHFCDTYIWEDTYTDLKGEVTYGYYNRGYTVTVSSFKITPDEHDYILDELEVFYKDYHRDRKERLNKIKRARTLKQWKET